MTETKKIIIFLLCMFLFLGHQTSLFARDVQTNYTTDKAEHRISIGLGGGVALSMGQSSDYLWEDNAPYYVHRNPDGTVDSFTPYRAASPVNHKAGGDALFDLGYELRKKRFIFGFGFRLHFDQLRTTLDTMEIAFGRQYSGQDAKYNYCFEQYDDRLQVLECAVPIYFGMEVGQYMYFHLGAVAGYACYAQHRTDARMRTELTLLKFIGTEIGNFRDLPSYGAFNMDDYSYKGRVENVNHWTLTPTVEIGARFQVNRRVQMRLGVYAGYAVQLGWNPDRVSGVRIVDFTEMGKDVCCTGLINNMELEVLQESMQSDIRQNIIFNSPLYSELQQKAFSNIVVGVKWTTLIQVGKTKQPCVCWTEFDVDPRQAKIPAKYK
ncbi:MAG: hypothetical protein ACI4TV_03110 [Paludibacteraceae bacterium]